jgi:bisphosphoglycerate-independent phosphoglycerate mutase (AlkP superfamily)
LNPVPFIILDSQYEGEYTIDTREIDEPGISNVMPTFMNLLGYKPPEMYRQSLIRFEKKT